MKQLSYLWCAFLVCACYCSCQDGLKIASNGKSNAIILADLADNAQLASAEVIQAYIEKTSNVRLDIADLDDKSGTSSITLVVDLELDETQMHLYSTNEDIVISAGSNESLRNAAYLFVEEVLGVKWFSPQVEEVPNRKQLVIDNFDIKYQPQITTRTVHSRLFYENPDYADKMKVTHSAFPSYAKGARVHTFHRFIPEEQYYQSHPEYYALRGEQRLPTQLCLTNRQVLNLVIDSVAAYFDREPEADIVSVSQDDNQQYCQCANCSKIDEEEGSHAGTMVRFVNQVAKHFPQKRISTLAYQHTRKPPKVKPEENVLITLCSIECDRSGPIDEKCIEFAKELEGWGKLTDNIRIWDYTTQFTNFLAPFPNIETIQPNIQLFRNNNAKWIFEQHSHHPSELFELRSYITAKLLWNPDADLESLLTEFTDGYYKEAGPHIRDYINHIHDRLSEDPEFFLFLYGDPSQAFNSFLSAEDLQAYNDYFNSAEQAVQDKPEILKRVMAARLSTDYAQLEACRKNLSDHYSMVTFASREPKVNPIVEQLLSRFQSTTKDWNVSLMNEMGFGVEEYIEGYHKALSIALKPNLAKGKSVVSLTKPRKYADEDPMVLTDGALGGSNFYANWLGYEGNDLEVVLDLGRAESISQISLNFLQVTNHIVFFPQAVTFWASQDGVQFEKLGKTENAFPLSKSSKVNDIQEFNLKFVEQPLRYIKIKAENKATPYWHHAAGLPSWLFVDEITVS